MLSSAIRTESRADGLVYNAADVGNVLNLTNIRTSLRSFPPCEVVACSTGSRRRLHLTMDGVKRLLSKSRSTAAAALAKEIGMNVAESLYTCVEQDSLAFIQQVFHGKLMVTQYFCCGYRIDLYFPKERVAVECDESFHCHQADVDIKRQAALTSVLECKFVRFRPQCANFQISQVINAILNAMNMM